MPSKLVKIEYCFPKLSSATSTTDQLVDSIFSQMYANGSIEYAGYLHDAELRADLIQNIGPLAMERYKRLTRIEQGSFAKIIESSIYRSFKKLHLPEGPINVFIFPWFPNAEKSKPLGGINAFAVHEQVLHLFIDVNAYSRTSLKETIVHEFNHLLYYQYKPKQKYSLKDKIIMEGLAEVFREEVVGGKPAPWSISLTRSEAKKALKKITPFLNSNNQKKINEILYGGSEYKKWTGYSIGYFAIKDLRRENSKLSWLQLFELAPLVLSSRSNKF